MSSPRANMQTYGPQQPLGPPMGTQTPGNGNDLHGGGSVTQNPRKRPHKQPGELNILPAFFACSHLRTPVRSMRDFFSSVVVFTAGSPFVLV